MPILSFSLMDSFKEALVTVGPYSLFLLCRKNIKAGIQYIFIGCVLISSFSKTECQNQAKEEEKPVIKMYSFVSAPVDDVASADTPAHNLVIRSNLKVS